MKRSERGPEYDGMSTALLVLVIVAALVLIGVSMIVGAVNGR